MNKKHPTCRWKCKKSTNRKHYILDEGFYWLLNVYFQRDKSLIDADIDFFKMRIGLYEDLLKVQPKSFISELVNYFDRASETIRKAISKMVKINSNYKFMEDNEYKISKEGIEWLCKNYFKHKYLELLEEYKMELTEKYIKAGYPYDIF